MGKATGFKEFKRVVKPYGPQKKGYWILKKLYRTYENNWEPGSDAWTVGTLLPIQ
ncbi:MAG: hypothetical protein CM1200mP12_19010 [Gammaproteobacteria bacterium]|nr:MAG: hypothetical protein CM1200mP12_19010 [Gammaproteobacteria bacterium]